MTRNIIIFLALVGLATVGYLALVNSVGVLGLGDDGAAPASVPESDANANIAALTIGGRIPVQQGGKMEVVRYDPQTGVARDRFRFATWTPVGDKEKEVVVSSPELSLRMANGLVLTVMANQGQIAVDRVEQVQSNPKRGSLRGEVKILIDRATDLTRVSATQPSPERVTIELEDLEFDLQVGTLSSKGRLHLHGPEFEIAGRGLFLEWNEADNQVKQLTLREGEQLTLVGAGQDVLGLGPARPRAPAAAPSTSQPAAQPAIAAGAAERSGDRARARPGVTYELILASDVRADQMQADRRVGGLRADNVRLLIDVGGDQDTIARRAAGEQPGASSQPAGESVASAPAVAGGGTTSQPATGDVAATQPAEPGRLVVRWSGPLTLNPIGEAPQKGKPRRHFEARGAVVLDQGPSQVLCEGLDYYDETKQIWLYAPRDGRVRFTRQNSAVVTAQSVYIDRQANLVKLIGDVNLRTTEAGGRSGRSAIHADLWAELRLREEPRENADGTGQPAIPALAAPSVQPVQMMGSAAPPASVPAPAPTEEFELNRLNSAKFVGGVRVQLDGDRLVAGQLDVRFRPQSRPGAAISELIDTAEASGDVRFRGGDQSMNCDRLVLDFQAADSGRVYPAELEASGAVVVRRGEATIRGRRLHVTTALLPSATPDAPPEVGVRRLEVTDRARLDDPENLVSARGAQIVANFSGRSELRDAVVSGTPERFAEVRADNYRVRGARIELDPGAELMQVNGRAWLAFEASRALGSVARRRSGRVVEVLAQRSLKVDAGNNRIEFNGDVVARSGDEALKAETVELLLRAAPQPLRSARVFRPTYNGWLALADLARRVTHGVQDGAPAPAAAVGVAGQTHGSTPSSTPSIDRLVKSLSGLRLADAGRARLPAMEFALAPTAREIRREPLRMIASDALFQSESLGPDGRPLTTAEVKSPRLDFEIPARRLLSHGQTALMMTSSVVRTERDAADEAVGLPSPLISRGPSQTGLKCERQMTYVIGQDTGGQRRDAVVFDGDVFFFHRTGREMLRFEQVLPDLQPAELARLPSRMTTLKCGRVEGEFVSEAREAGDPRGGSMRLAWLIASTEVNLRDEQDPVVRTVYCDRLEFNREQALVTVTGSPGTPARVFIENTQTNRLDQPIVGESVIIDLNTNQIRTPSARGEFRR